MWVNVQKIIKKINANNKNVLDSIEIINSHVINYIFRIEYTYKVSLKYCLIF